MEGLGVNCKERAMNMRQLRRRHVAATAHRAAQAKADQEYSEYMHAQAALDDDWDGEYEQRDTTCRYCSGTGSDPWNDGITPCEHCDGEGYEWWN